MEVDFREKITERYPVEVYQWICGCLVKEHYQSLSGYSMYWWFTDMSGGKSSEAYEDRIKASVGIKCTGALRVVIRGK